MSSKSVSAAVVRAWANENNVTIGARGVLNPEAVKAFHKANKGKRYAPASDAEKRTVTVPVKVLDSVGRASTRPVTVTTAHARDLLGHPKGKRGRIAKDMLSLALEAERLA